MKLILFGAFQSIVVLWFAFNSATYSSRPDFSYAHLAVRNEVAKKFSVDASVVNIRIPEFVERDNKIAFRGSGELLTNLISTVDGGRSITANATTQFNLSTLVTLKCSWWVLNCYQVTELVIDAQQEVGPRI